MVASSKLNTLVPGHPQDVPPGFVIKGAATSWSRMFTNVFVRIDPAVGGAISCDSNGSSNGFEICAMITRFTSFGGGGNGRRNSSGINSGKISLLIWKSSKSSVPLNGGEEDLK